MVNSVWNYRSLKKSLFVLMQFRIMKLLIVFSLFALISVGTLATASAQYSDPICGYGYVYDSKDARELISCFQKNPNLLDVEPNMAYWIASAYSQLGDNEKAIMYLELDLNPGILITGTILIVPAILLGSNGPPSQVNASDRR